MRLEEVVVKVPLLKLNTGAIMPAFGFGTWQLSEGREVIESVSEALKVGYRSIDTAKIYGNERGVGEAIRASGLPRDEIFITTKLWPSDFGSLRAREAFEGSLERLGLDYIDLYLIHWPGDDQQLRQESWQALSEIYDEGLAKAVGVSNFGVHHLQGITSDSSLTPAVNQIEFHPFVYGDQAPILDFCRRSGIVVEAYSPLAMGRQMNHPMIESVARKTGKTNAQVMLRWAFQHQTVPIPRSSSPEHIRSNFEIFNFELSKDEMQKLDGLSQ